MQPQVPSPSCLGIWNSSIRTVCGGVAPSHWQKWVCPWRCWHTSHQNWLVLADTREISAEDSELISKKKNENKPFTWQTQLLKLRKFFLTTSTNVHLGTCIPHSLLDSPRFFWIAHRMYPQLYFLRWASWRQLREEADGIGLHFDWILLRPQNDDMLHFTSQQEHVLIWKSGKVFWKELPINYFGFCLCCRFYQLLD